MKAWICSICGRKMGFWEAVANGYTKTFSINLPNADFDLELCKRCTKKYGDKIRNLEAKIRKKYEQLEYKETNKDKIAFLKCIQSK